MIVMVLFFGLTIAALIFRQSLTEKLVISGIRRFNAHYQAKLLVGSFALDGLSGVTFRNISLQPLSGDTLMRIGYLHANFDMSKLFGFNLALRNLEMKDAWFHFVRRDSTTNYMFLLNAGAKTDQKRLQADQPVNYAELADRTLNALFDKIPSSITIDNLHLDANLNSNKFGFRMGQLAISGHEFETLIEESDHGKVTPWVLRGDLDAGNRSARFKLFARNRQAIVWPYIGQRWRTYIASDTLHFSLSSAGMVDHVLKLSGLASASNLVMDQPRLSTGHVFFGRVLAEYHINIAPNYIELDSTSKFIFNKIDLNPYLCFRVEPSKQITIILNKPHFNANDFFASLPKGLFYNLAGIKAGGDLGFHLYFFVDLARPDDLIFSSGLDKQNFKIIRYGNTDFCKINTPFLYTAYEKGVAVRTFQIGPANPNFRTLEAIPSYLKNAILTSEDGQFYNHRGFLADAFRQAIIANIKERRFVRGGSTISMQLIKNVFLSRDKTITRKMEEALIVWLIENNDLSSKNRMYEVYLNIIEMGPMIYGVNEGAQFYFGKEVSQLSLAEAIYMASIVPHPKWFRDTFNKDGSLREFLAFYYRLVSFKMFYKGLISQNDFNALLPQVELKGAARWTVLPVVSIPSISGKLGYSAEMKASAPAQ